MFISAGTLRWTVALAYSGVYIFGSVLSRVIANIKNPESLEERGRYNQVKDVQRWDKILVPLTALFGPMIGMLIAGVDQRYGWTNVFPTWSQVLCLLIGVLGFIISSWAMIENRFFSAVVRIQEERNHEVRKSGPYQIIRHPGYAGGIL